MVLPEPEPTPEPEAEPATEPTPEPPAAPALSLAEQIPAFAITNVGKAFYQATVPPLRFADREMDAQYKLLPKSPKKALSGIYNSLTYGLKSSDAYKVSQAVKKLTLELKDKGFTDTQTLTLAGMLYSRAGDHEAAGLSLARAGHFDMASREYFSNGHLPQAGACAIEAIRQETDAKELKVLFTILEESILDSRDIYLLCERLPSLPEETVKHQTALFTRLAQEAKIRTRDQKAAREELAMAYPGEAMVRYWYGFEGRSWTSPAASGPSSLPEKEAPAVQEPEPLYAGMITSTSWMQEKGSLICLQDQQVLTFAFKDVPDSRFRETLKVTPEELREKPPIVEFHLKGTRPVDIAPMAASITLAPSLLESAGDPSVLPYALACIEAGPIEKLDADSTLLPMINLAIRGADSPGGMDLLLRAKEIYLNNRTRLGDLSHSWQSYDPLVDVWLLLGEKKKALSVLDEILDMNIFPNQKMERRIRYIAILQQEALQSPKDTSLQERILSQTGSFIEEGRMSGNWILNNKELSYYCSCTVHLVEAEAYFALEEWEKASQALSRIDRDQLQFSDQPRVNALSEKLQRLEEKEREQVRQARKEKEKAERERLKREKAEAEAQKAQEAQELLADEEYVYREVDGLDALGLSPSDVIDYALSVRGEERLPIMLAYLKAGTLLEHRIGPVYQSVSLGINNPLEVQDYSADALLTRLSQQSGPYATFQEYCLAAATLRCAFASPESLTYTLPSLHDSIGLFVTLPPLEDLYVSLSEFRRTAAFPMDAIAAYHGTSIQTKLEVALKDARTLYANLFEAAGNQGDGLKPFFDTRKAILSDDSKVGIPLCHILKGEFDALRENRQAFRDEWMKGHLLDENAIDDYIREVWDRVKSRNKNKKRERNFVLQGQRRNNLRSNIRSILELVSDVYDILEQQEGLGNQQTLSKLESLLPDARQRARDLVSACQKGQQEAAGPQEEAGLYILSVTARTICEKLDGTWQKGQEKLIFTPFLRTDAIVLNEDYLPELDSSFCRLPDFNIFARIRSHAESRQTMEEHLTAISSPARTCHNFGTAILIRQYLNQASLPVPPLPSYAGECVGQAARMAKESVRSFHQDFAMAVSQGEVEHGNLFLQNARNMIGYWYGVCDETGNYGFLYSLIQSTRSYIQLAAEGRKASILADLEKLKANNQSIFEASPEAESRIRKRIAEGNLTAAEDLMNHLTRGDVAMDLETPEAIRTLENFWAEYDSHYRQVSDLSNQVQNLFGRSTHNKEQKGALGLI